MYGVSYLQRHLLRHHVRLNPSLTVMYKLASTRALELCGINSLDPEPSPRMVNPHRLARRRLPLNDTLLATQTNQFPLILMLTARITWKAKYFLPLL